jgi:two-component response regulator (ARR-B family)
MVTNAQTALDMLRERKEYGNQFDLVISNVAMPKPNMDGFKLLELIGLETDLPVICKALAQTYFLFFYGTLYGRATDCECLGRISIIGTYANKS